MIFVFDRVENMVGKVENGGYQHFLLFPVFLKGFFLRVISSRDCALKSYAPFSQCLACTLCHFILSFPFSLFAKLLLLKKHGSGNFGLITLYGHEKILKILL